MMNREDEVGSKHLLMKQWKDKYKPIPIQTGCFPLAKSLFIYASSPENLTKLEGQDEYHVWSLKWGSEDVFLVPGSKLKNEPGYVGYVITEIPWGTEERSNYVVCVESPTICESCDGMGEDANGDDCNQCGGHGEFWVNYGL